MDRCGILASDVVSQASIDQASNTSRHPDAAARAGVWEILSELYLDTEHDALDLRRMAEQLAHSPYALAELHEIETWEVAPVVMPNLFSVAGAWSGFDTDWLLVQCSRRHTSPTWRRRAATALGWRRVVRWATGDYWVRLGPMIDAARKNGYRRDR